MMKETISAKIFKQFYNLSGPVDEYKRTQAHAIGNTVAIMLYWFNTVAVLIATIIALTTNDYLSAFMILASSIFIFTVFVAGSYVIYAGHKHHLADQEVEPVDLHAAYRQAILKSLKAGLVLGVIEYFLNAYLLSLHGATFTTQLTNPITLVPVVIYVPIFTIWMAIVYCRRIKKVK